MIGEIGHFEINNLSINCWQSVNEILCKSNEQLNSGDLNMRLFFVYENGQVLQTIAICNWQLSKADYTT